MIIDVKEVLIDKKTGKVTIDDFAWTIFPLFEVLEVDDNFSSAEYFVNSGLFMLPLMKGAVDPEYVRAACSNEENQPWEFLQN